jgi:DNA primase
MFQPTTRPNVPDHAALDERHSLGAGTFSVHAAVPVSRQSIMRVLPDAVVPSRNELVSYWPSVAPRALKHLRGRPLTLVRHVHGVTFFHKGPLPPIPDTVHHPELKKSTGDGGVRVWVDKPQEREREREREITDH